MIPLLWAVAGEWASDAEVAQHVFAKLETTGRESEETLPDFLADIDLKIEDVALNCQGCKSLRPNS